MRAGRGTGDPLPTSDIGRIVYAYPPDLSEDATQLVLKQAELTTENGESKLPR